MVDISSLMDPSMMGSMLTFGLVVVVTCVVLYVVSMFSMKETSFEDVLAEQKKAKEMEDKERARLNKINKQKRENMKKKFDSKKKKDVSPDFEVQIKAANETSTQKKKAEKATPKPEKVVQKNEKPEKAAEKPIEKAPPKSKKAETKEVKPAKPILKQEPEKNVQQPEQSKPVKQDKKKKPEPVVQKATNDVEVEKESARKDNKKKKNEKDGALPPRKRSVSFSDEVGNKKTETESDKMKKKKGKKTSQPQQEQDEHPIISSMKEITFEQKDVQILIQHMKEKYDVALGSPNKEANMKHQLNKKEQALQHSMSRCMEAEKKIDQLNQDIILEKTKLASLEKASQENYAKAKLEAEAKMKDTALAYQKEIEQLQIKLIHSGDPEILKKEIAQLKQQNNILKGEVEKSARLSGENAHLASELQSVKNKLQDSINHKNELEKKLSHHSEQYGQQQVEHQRQYGELTMAIKQHEDKYNIVSMELNKTKLELQNNQGDSSKLMEQIAALNDQINAKSVFEEKYNSTVQSLSQLNAEKDELSNNNKNLQCQLEAAHNELQQAKVSINSLSQQSDGQLNSQQNIIKEKEDALAETQTSLDETKQELSTLKEELDKLKKKNNELREKNWKAMDAVSNAEKSSKEKVQQEQHNTQVEMRKLKDEVKQALEKAFPDVSSSEQDFSSYLSTVLQEAVALQTTEVVSVEGPELKAANNKIKELEESVESKSSENSNLQSRIQALQKSLDGALDRARKNEATSNSQDEEVASLKEQLCSSVSEIEKYKNILQSTEDILSKLQASVESEESVWRKKVEEAHEDAQNAKHGAEELRVAIEKLSAENTSLQEAASNNQKLQSEITMLKEELQKSKSSNQENGDCNSEPYVTVSDPSSPLHFISTEQQCENTPSKSVSCQSDSPTLVEQSDACTDTDPIVTDQDGFLVIEQVEQASSNLQNGFSEENEKLKERLEKEKMMTKNLGQAATKLQTVLKQTQEQLNKEREKNKSLSEQLEGSFEQQQQKLITNSEAESEGTSV